MCGRDGRARVISKGLWTVSLAVPGMTGRKRCCRNCCWCMSNVGFQCIFSSCCRSNESCNHYSVVCTSSSIRAVILIRKIRPITLLLQQKLFIY